MWVFLPFFLFFLNLLLKLMTVYCFGFEHLFFGFFFWIFLFLFRTSQSKTNMQYQDLA